MDKEEIRKLEPKYTGNTRHLTEGEAAEIVHDPDNGVEDEIDRVARAASAFFFINRRDNSGSSNME